MTINQITSNEHLKVYGSNSSTFWIMDCTDKEIKNIRQWFEIHYNGESDYTINTLPVLNEKTNKQKDKPVYIVIYDKEIATAFKLTFCH